MHKCTFKNGAHMNQEYKISVVIPVYGNLQYTIGAIKSLEEKSTENVNEIIIIDNHPEKDTARYFFTHPHKNVNVYCPQTNLGVSISWDIGIKIAKNNLVAVINNDIEILTQDWDRVLMNQWTKHTDALILCPWPLGSPDEALNKDGDVLSGLNGSFFVIDRHGLQLTENYKRSEDYIDHRYEIAYWEDADLLCQVRKINKASYVLPKVCIVHFSNKTAGPMLPSDKGMHNPYWRNLDKFNKKYGVYIWDYFQVYMSNILHENTHERLI
jgi:O-antigen biosynthesis protein